MFNQLRSLFFSTANINVYTGDDRNDSLPLDAVDNHDEIDDGRLKYRYVKASALPADIRATAEPWGTDKTGQKWFKIAEPIEAENAIAGEQRDVYQVSDYDDAELSALDEIAALDAECEAIVSNFNEQCDRIKAEAIENGQTFLPHHDWDGSDD